MDEVVCDHWVYPLGWGERLASADWFPLHGHRLLSSRFVAYACAHDRRADLGTALILWAEAFRQDPAGTLPDDDTELAQLARFGADVPAWRAARAGALHGWRPVHIDGDPVEPAANRRLGHPLIAQIAVDMMRRRTGAKASRDANRIYQTRKRVRERMEAMKLRVAASPEVVNAVADWLMASSLWITEQNIRAALANGACGVKIVSDTGA
jgi:hypothetical protein